MPLLGVNCIQFSGGFADQDKIPFPLFFILICCDSEKTPKSISETEKSMTAFVTLATILTVLRPALVPLTVIIVLYWPGSRIIRLICRIAVEVLVVTFPNRGLISNQSAPPPICQSKSPVPALRISIVWEISLGPKVIDCGAINNFGASGISNVIRTTMEGFSSDSIVIIALYVPGESLRSTCTLMT